MTIDWWQIIKSTLKLIVDWWPLLVILLAIAFIRIFFENIIPNLIDRWKKGIKFKKGSEWRSDREFLQYLRGMQPSEFESYIADLFNKLGYKAEAVGQSHDGGVDVIAEKNGIKHYVQCKKYITSIVSVGAVRDFYGAVADHVANGKSYFVTTNKFTLEAEKFAEDKPIELIDGYKLLEYIKLSQKK